MKVNCKYCKKEFNARPADIKRGWGKFCSKSCKAKWQCRNNPKDNFFNYLDSRNGSYTIHENDEHPFSMDALGQWDDC